MTRPSNFRKETSNALARLLWQTKAYHTEPIYVFTHDCSNFIIGCELKNITQILDTVAYSDDLLPEKYWVNPNDGGDFCMPQLCFGLDSNCNIELRVEVWDIDEALSEQQGEVCRQSKTASRKVCSPVLMFSLIQTLKKLGLIFYE